MDELVIPTCKVRVVNHNTGECLNLLNKDMNIAEIEAIKVSSSLKIGNRYYEVKELIFNYGESVLEISVE